MRELWRAKLDDADRACVTGVVAGPNAVVVAGPGLLGLDLETGERRWQAEVAVPALQPLAVADGQLFVLTTDPKRLQALDPVTGKAIWSRAYGSGLPYGVAVIGGEVVAVGGSSIRVFSLAGEPLRSATLKGAYPMTVAEAPGGDFLVTGMKGQHSLFRVARESLELQWTARVTGGWTATQPATVSGDTVIFHQYAAWLTAYDVVTGEQRWRKKKADGRHGLCLALPDGDLIWGTDALSRARVSDAKVVWSVPGIRAAALAGGDRIVTASSDNDEVTLAVRSTATGEATATLGLAAAPVFAVADDMLTGPLLVDGTLVVSGLQQGVVVATDLA